MSTLSNRPNTAVLVIDVQNGVVANGHNRDEVVSNINDVVTKARAAEVPVVWIQHDAEDLPKGSDNWQIVPELTPIDDEVKVEKQYGDSFEATNLERVLARARRGQSGDHRRANRCLRALDPARRGGARDMTHYW